MKGYVEHNSRACTLGTHTNRGAVADMCPVYLELRRQRLKERMRRDRASYAQYLLDRRDDALRPRRGF